MGQKYLQKPNIKAFCHLPFPVLLSFATEIWWALSSGSGYGKGARVAAPADWIELISLHKQIDKV